MTIETELRRAENSGRRITREQLIAYLKRLRDRDFPVSQTVRCDFVIVRVPK
jgi:hypothetical protein